MAASMVCLMHLVKAGVTKTIYSRVPLHARDANIPVSQSKGFETLTNVKIYLSHHTNIFFYSVHLLVEEKPKLISAFIEPKRGGVVSTLSLPSTNFRPQHSVHKLPSTNFCPQTSVDIWSLTILIHCLHARA